jgi:diaminopimelate decarboxylase
VAFFYENSRLRCGSPRGTGSGLSADVEEIARARGTPAYIYDLDAIRERYRALAASTGKLKASVHYAVKANPNAAVVGALVELGAGADVVSAGEIAQAMAAGAQPERIIFSGVGKTEKEIARALRLGVKQLNVESPAELARIARLAKALGTAADVAFRMNPDVSPETHPYITTGFRENKFGMDESFLPELVEIVRAAGSALRLRGLTLHIGSQLLELASLSEAIVKTREVFTGLRALGFPLDRFDVGGGLGIDYETPDESRELGLVASYGLMLERLLGDLGAEILLEPGRILVGRAGILVGEVQYTKRAPAKTFAILDTGMHHLLRPALYQARHRVLPVRLDEGSATEAYDVVGPICESSDFLARDAKLPSLRSGDLLAIADAGAYGRSMASQYNAHQLPVEVAVSGGVAATAERQL